jgi:drug/metabolite transporter (DMT)-like permease
MSWQLSLAFFFIAAVAQSLWQRSYSQKTKLPDSFPPAISYLLGVLPLSIIVGLTTTHHVRWSAWVVCLLVSEGLFIGLAFWLQFIAVKQMPIARYETIFQTFEIVSITFGWLLLGERLSFVQIIGGVLLLVAAYIAITAPQGADKALHTHIKPQAFVVALLSALALGIGLVIEKATLHYMDNGAYYIFGFGTQTIALLAIASISVSGRIVPTIKLVKPLEIRRSTIMGILSALAGFAYIYSLQKSNNISLISTLTAFTLPLTLVGSFLILHERENKLRMVFASALGVVGLIITSLH